MADFYFECNENCSKCADDIKEDCEVQGNCCYCDYESNCPLERNRHALS